MNGEFLRKKHKQKWGLFARQQGKCCFCSVPMLLAFHHIKDPPKNLATLEHADDRFSHERGTHNGEYRNSLCCWQCNFERGQTSQASQPLVELHRRAGNGAFRATFSRRPRIPGGEVCGPITYVISTDEDYDMDEIKEVTPAQSEKR